MIYAVVLRNLQIPALNKWTKLAPVLSQITLMANFFRVIARAFGSKLEASGQVRDAEASGQVDPEDADMSEGEILGAPSDSAVAFRKAAQRRMNKGYRFLSHPGTPGTLLVWMVISDIVMPIHYRLFKYATFFHTPRTHGVGCSNTVATTVAIAALPSRLSLRWQTL